LGALAAVWSAVGGSQPDYDVFAQTLAIFGFALLVFSDSLLLPLHQILVPLQPMRVLVMSLATSVACESHVTVDLTYIWISISVVAMIVMALVYVARRVEGANYLHRQRNESTADTVIALATPKSPDW
ncbi:hypothetical protein B5M09_012385, partial [Aphanomyces astaci]